MAQILNEVDSFLNTVEQSGAAPLDEDDPLERISQALVATEGSGETAVSHKGARGKWQIMPQTFAQYADPDDSFDDETARERAARRKIADDYAWALERSGGDRDRAAKLTAAAYNGGRGGAAVWAAGNGAQRGDGITNLNSYVERFNGKLGGGAADNTPADPYAHYWMQDGDKRTDDGQIAATRRQAAADESPFATSARRGWESMTSGVASAGQLLAGNEAGAAQTIGEQARWEQANPAPMQNQRFMARWQSGDYLGAMLSGGFWSSASEQLANSAPALVGNVAGAIGGLAVGGLPGAFVGGTVGALPGNIAVESGAKILARLQQAGIDPENESAVTDYLRQHRGELLQDGAIKGATVSAFDGAANVIGMKLFGGPAMRLGEASDAALAKMGVNLADSAAVAAAKKAPAFRQAMAAPVAEYRAATTLGKDAARAGGVLGVESAGEFAGEYVGQEASGDEGSFNEALLEAVMSVGQSGVTTVAEFGYSHLKQKLPEGLADIPAVPVQPAAPVRQANSPLSNAAAQGQAVQQAAVANDPLREEIEGLRPLIEGSRVSVAPAGGGKPHSDRAPDWMSSLDRENRAEVLHAWSIAKNPTLDPRTRETALANLQNFLASQTGPAIPDGDGVSEAAPGQSGVPREQALTPTGRPGGSDNGYRPDWTPGSPVPTYDVGATPKLEDPASVEARDRAAADYEAAYQDLVKIEQLGASDAEHLAAKQRTDQAAADLQRAESQLVDLQAAIEGNRQQQHAGSRAQLRKAIQADDRIAPGNKWPAFVAALKRTFGADFAKPTDEDKADFEQHAAFAETFAETAPAAAAKSDETETATVPSPPNEMDAAALGIRERGVRRDRANDEAAQAENPAAASPADRGGAVLAEPAAVQPMGALADDDAAAGSVAAADAATGAVAEGLGEGDAQPAPTAAVEPDLSDDFARIAELSGRSLGQLQGIFDKLREAHGLETAVRSVKNKRAELEQAAPVSPPEPAAAADSLPANDPVSLPAAPSPESEPAKKAVAARQARRATVAATAAAPTAAEATPVAPSVEPVATEPGAVDSDFERGKAMMGEGLEQLMTLLGGKTNLLPDEEAAILPVMAKIFRGAALMGYAKFAEASRFVMTTLRGMSPEVAAKIEIKNLQAAFINLNGIAAVKEISGFDSIDALMAPVAEMKAAIAEAEATTDTNPSEAQKEAENYRTGKFNWNGLTISVENPAGSVRRGVDQDGSAWETPMPATYGRILGTVGADKDHVDVFVGEHPHSEQVWLVNQTVPGGNQFDEHKTGIGFASAEEFKAAYLGSFSDGFGDRVFGSLVGPYSVEEFKALLPALKQKKPYGVAETPAYALPEGDIYRDWNSSKEGEGGRLELAGPEHPQFVPNARQQRVMDAVAQAIDAGVFYNREIDEFVARVLNVGPAIRSRRESGVEGGDFGYDVYQARQAVQAQRARAKAQAIAETASVLRVGDKLGIVVPNDFKEIAAAVITAIDGDQYVVTGKRGRQTVTMTTNAAGVKATIDRAFSRGRRKDDFAALVTGRSAGLQKTEGNAAAVVESQAPADDAAQDDALAAQVRALGLMGQQAMAKRLGIKGRISGADVEARILAEHPDDIAHALVGHQWNGKTWDTPLDQVGERVAAEEVAAHIEGPAAEEATPAVVADSLKTGVQNSRLSLKEQQKYLLGELDKAIAAVPDQSALLRELAAQKNRKVTTQQDAAIRDDNVAKIAREIGFVTFDVPGDGKFKVMNTDERLRAFKKEVEKSAGFRNSKPANVPTNPGPGSGDSTITDLLADGELLAARELAEVRGKPFMYGVGAHTDGRKWAVLYPLAKSLEVAGRPMFIGQAWNRESKALDGVWSIIDLETGNRFASEQKAADAVAKAHKFAKEQPEAIANAILKVKDESKARTQEDLAADWAGWATEQEGGIDAERDAEQARADEARQRNDELKAKEQERTAAHLAAQQREATPPALDYRGFERRPLGNGSYTLNDGNLSVQVEPLGGGKHQARVGSAKSSPQLSEQDAIDWAANYRSEAQRSAQAATAPVSSREGQMNLANRASAIAAIKGMNEQLRALAPGEAFSDASIERGDLDTLRDTISTALVRAQRRPARSDAENVERESLRKQLDDLSGAELKEVFARLNLAGKTLTVTERINMLLEEPAAEVREALAALQAQQVQAESHPAIARKPDIEKAPHWARVLMLDGFGNWYWGSHGVENFRVGSSGNLVEISSGPARGAARSELAAAGLKNWPKLSADNARAQWASIAKPGRVEDQAPAIPEGYKKVTEYYRDNKPTDGYAAFAVGERVRNKESRYVGQVDSLFGSGPVFDTLIVQYDNGTRETAKSEKLEAAPNEAAEAIVASPSLPEGADAPVADDADPSDDENTFTEAEALKRMVWQDMGTEKGIRTFSLKFFDAEGNPETGKGGSGHATIEQSVGQGGDKKFRVYSRGGDYTGAAFDTLKGAKEEGKRVSLPSVRADGYIKDSAIDRALRSVGIDPGAPVDEAAKLRKQADQLQNAARTMLAGIPPGQPVRSTRDANLRERSAETSRRAADLYRQADEMDAAKGEEKAPEGKAIHEDVAAFTASMTPLQKSKAVAALEHLIRLDGAPMSRQGAVHSLIGQGRQIEQREGQRALVRPTDGSYQLESGLGKTAMDYAAFLLGRDAQKTEDNATSEAAEPWDALPERERLALVRGQLNSDAARALYQQPWAGMSDADRAKAQMVMDRQPLLVRALIGGVVSPDEYNTKEVEATFSHISHHAGDRAYIQRNAFLESVQAQYDNAAPLAETDQQKAVLKSETEQFKRDYLAKERGSNQTRASTYSGHIAGDANLNANQANARNAALDRSQQGFSGWLKTQQDRVKDAVLAARNDDQRAAEQQAKDDKAANAKAKLQGLVKQLMGFKPGDAVVFGKYPVAKVSLDKAGYPNSVTVEATDLTDNKFDLASVLFKGDKGALRTMVDELRAADVAPAAEPASGPYSFAEHVTFRRRMAAGEVSAEELKATFKRYQDSLPDIKAELAKKTIKELAPNGAGSYKKGEIIDQIAGRLGGAFLIRDVSVSYSPLSGETYAGALAKLIAQTTDAEMAEYVERVQEGRSASAEARLQAEAAQANPQTLGDFRDLVAAKGLDALSPEQKRRFEDLQAERSLTERAELKARNEALRASIAAAPQSAGTTPIVQGKHTKHGHDLWILNLTERVEPEAFKSLLASAKRLGGDYSSYRGNGATPGWQFKTPEGAAAFAKLVGGDAADAKALSAERQAERAEEKEGNAVEKLRAMADKLEASANEGLGRERNTNTARRARMASGAEAAARAQLAFARTMRNLAGAIESGQAKFLNGLRTKAQVEQLMTAVKVAHDEEIRQKYPSYADQLQHQGDTVTESAADKVLYPVYSVYVDDLANIARALGQRDGSKALAQRLRKAVADTQAAEYAEVVRANPLKFALFEKDSAKPAIFGTEDAAKSAIRRSNLSDSAEVHTMGRGKHVVTVSRQMAIDQKRFTPGERERITLRAEVAETMLDAVDAYNAGKGRFDQVTVGWWLPEVRDRRRRLAAMNLMTGQELRAALREFIKFRSELPAADPVKALERALIGNKSIGVDFFPTPAGVAADMVERAGIESGMSVLEPSAGNGNIAEAIRAAGVVPDVVEMSSALVEILEAKGFEVVGRDFMDLNPRSFFTYGDTFEAPDGTRGAMRGSNGDRVTLVDAEGESLGYFNRDELKGIAKNGTAAGYDRIVMNPPFGGGADIEHVRHAFAHLKPGGRIVAIVGEGSMTRSDAKATEFRDWLDTLGAEVESLPENTFRDPALMATTGANARLVTIEKPAVAGVAMESRGAENAERLDVGALRNLIVAFRNFFPGASRLDIRAVASLAELPDEVAASPRAEGVYLDGRGQVYLIAGNISTTQRAYQVLQHEVVGHYGLAAMGEKYDRIKAMVLAKAHAVGGVTGREAAGDANYATVEAVMQRYPEADEATVAAEVLARLAELPQRAPTWFKATVAMVRQWMRDLMRKFGLTVEPSMQDAADLIQIAAARLRSPLGGGPGSGVSITQDELRALYSEGDIADFWKEFSHANDGRGNDGTLRSSVVEQGYRAGHRGTVRSGRMQDDIGIPGQEVMYFDEPFAGFRGYYTLARTGKVGGKVGFTFYVVPAEVAPAMDERHSLAELQDRAALQITFVQEGDNRFALSVGEPDPGSTVFAAMARMGRVSADPSAAGNRDYHTVALDRPATTMQAVMTEAVRRLAMMNGQVPEVVVPGRDTGARAGDRQQRAFSPEQIQARFSVAGDAAAKVGSWFADPVAAGKSAQNYLSGLFNADSSQTFNWYHKTIGSQFHKAKIDRDYAKVFNLAQAFIDDVSRFGTEAADLAPGLLPKMDTIAGAFREAKNYRRDDADAKALAAPIFEGTLYEVNGEMVGKVWTDQELRDNYNLNDRQIGLYREGRRAIDHSLETLATAEIQKLAKSYFDAKAGEVSLIPPVNPELLDMNALARYYAGQFDIPLNEAKRQLAKAKERRLNDDELLAQNAVSLGKGRVEYARVMMAARAEADAGIVALEAQVKQLGELKQAFLGKAEQIKSLQAAGYAPLMRFGKYTLDVTETVEALNDDGSPVLDEKTGESGTRTQRHFFSMFEDEAEAKEAAKIMAEEYPNAVVSLGVASQDGHQLFGAVHPGSLEMLAKLAGSAGIQDSVIQQYYRDALSQRSALKRLIHRKGIEGYSKDVTRSLASFILSNARATASAKHFGELMEAAAEIPKEKGDVMDEAVKLINYIRDPNEEAGALRGLLFMQFLGGSVAAAAVNLTQTISTTAPFLHQYGVGFLDLARAGKWAGERMRDRVPEGMSGKLKVALDQAEKEGIVSPHNIHNLMGETGAAGLGRHRGWRVASHLWGSMFSMAEQFNRETAFIAAFEAAEKLGKDGLNAAYQAARVLNAGRGIAAPDAALYASPYAFAKNAVQETQFVLSKAARPNWSRGAVGATLFTFKQFAVFYMELLKRLPNKERALMLAALTVMAGAGGLPGADDLDDLVDTLGQAMGYNTNADRWKEENARKVFGTAGGNFVMHGVSAFLPTELSSRLGMGNLLPATGLGKGSNSGQRDREFSELFGAAGGYFKQLMQGMDYMAQGRYGQALTQAVAPKAIKDAAKGLEMAESGVYDDSRGRRVVDVSGFDAFIKAIGFQPTTVSEIQRIKSYTMQDVALVKNVKAAASEVWAQGVADRDPSKVMAARKMVASWNEKNPESPIAVSPAAVQRRVAAMKLSAGERMARVAPKVMREAVAERFAE